VFKFSSASIFISSGKETLTKQLSTMGKLIAKERVSFLPVWAIFPSKRESLTRKISIEAVFIVAAYVTPDNE
jgi:hypothetical protein